MSTKSNASHAGERTAEIGVDGSIGSGTFRLLALCCVLVMTATYVSVLQGVTQVVGGTESLFALVAAMLVAATVLAYAIRPVTATIAAAAAGTIGFAYYLESSGAGVGVVFSASDAILADTVALMTGLPLIRMVEADVWALAFVPAPVFLSWYLAVRGRYGLSALPGGVALTFLVLTGDAGTTITLMGTLAAIGAVGFGELERRGGSIAQTDLLAVIFAVSIVLSLSVTFVPASTSRTSQFAGGDAGTLEGTINAAPERSAIGGSVELSPEVRFTVQADRESYWRTGVYDRFTGDEWVRTGERQAYDGQLAPPPGEYERNRQLVTAETTLEIMPAAPQPIAVEGELTEYTDVTRHGQPHPSAPLREGDSYIVESAAVDRDPATLRAAGTNYPAPITERFDYLQTPESTSSEFERRTEEITSNAETPFDKAIAIQRYLRSSKEYSLEVDQPDGNVAEAFLLEMDQGYCVYFATTMVQMLRTEDVPARYVTGYTSGQEVSPDEYVVRGTDAHAWVEVYFPDHGWVAFDPTPSSRDEVHDDYVQQAREEGADNVDTEESQDEPISEDESEGESPTDDPADETETNGTETDPGSDEEQNGTEPNPNDGNNGQSDTGGTDGPEERDEDGLWSTFVALVTISRETAAFLAVALVGLGATVRRTGVTTRARDAVGLYWQRVGDDPDRDAERAFRRLERLLAREYRPRKRSESARGYLAALESASDGSIEPRDPRVETVVDRYERAIYGGGIGRDEADEAVAIVDELARERLPLIGRNRN